VDFELICFQTTVVVLESEKIPQISALKKWQKLCWIGICITMKIVG